MKYDVVVVGGGIAGLSSAAYLSKYGYKVILLEQQDKIGGLINSFDYKGFTFDSGIRAIENSGIVFPMLKQLGIQIDFVKSVVSLTISDHSFVLESKQSLAGYERFLKKVFPESQQDVEAIIQEIDKVMKYMDILYGIDNPLFVDYQNDLKYITKTILPWLFKYLMTIRKIEKLNQPIDEYLKRFTSNQKLIDMIAQHFFNKTPAFFALSYFSLYLDYNYPLGGTGTIPKKIGEYINDNHGIIKTNCQIQKVDVENKSLIDQDGNQFSYQKLIWAADMKSLYHMIDSSKIKNPKLLKQLDKQKQLIVNKTGGDSILTVYLTLDINVDDLKKRIGAHVFYTPKTDGLSNKHYLSIKEKVISHLSYSNNQKDILEWLNIYLETTTYEISCPVIRDASLAPMGKSAVIISTLFDFQMTKHILELGFYNEFKAFCENKISQIFISQYLKKDSTCLIDCFSSTPLTIEKYTANTDGAITGWAFTNNPIPTVHKLSKIAASIKTPLPDVYQAGQWSFSPSGLPTSILTGKLAADKVKKGLK